MKKNFLSIVAAAMIALPVIAQAAPVKIGFINSITGKEAQIGENLTNGAAMAIGNGDRQTLRIISEVGGNRYA